MLASLITPEALADQSVIAQEVFFAMAGMELTTASAHAPTGESLIASLLYYTEGSEGAILIECDPALAFAFTSQLMSVNLPSSLDEDVADAMGELVNMIGGNLKGLMPPTTCITIPVVLSTDQLNQVMVANKRLSRVCLTTGSGHCCVSLLEALHC